MKVLLSVLLITLGFTPLFAQQDFGCICSTDVPYATGPSNSHKLAFPSEMLFPEDDTITLVFQSAESIYLYTSGNGASQPWSGPIASYPGHNPGITYGKDGDRHLVWEMIDTISGVMNIFYTNLEFRMGPLNVSCSNNNCYHPDVFADSSGVAHIVWEEESTGAGRQIWYRTANENGLLSERFCLSATAGTCSLPAIEQFKDTIVVIYHRFDPTLPRKYAIMKRCRVNDAWQPEEVLMDHMLSLNHPALDFILGNEGFSAAWDVDFDGNLEAHFVGGNGGGYSTSGASTMPVLATIGSTWSYLFWQEDSAGEMDIYTHFYYFLSGWYNIGSIREFFQIDEPVYAPSCLGALAVWTQGDIAPYKVMWGFFDYPIAIEECSQFTANGAPPTATILRNVLRLNPVFGPRSSVLLLDITGRKMTELLPGVNDVSRLVPGVYFVRQGYNLKKVIVLR